MVVGAAAVFGEEGGALRVVEAQTPYQWESVAIGGGGWMVSIAVHPKIADVLWLGSDVAGPWNREGADDCWHMQAWNRWTPANVSGVIGMALDPRDGQTVYVERGEQHNDASTGLYVTRDGGGTWRLALNKYSLTNAGPARKWGPSVAVDPNRPEVVYWGTFRDGAWRSMDAGKTWQGVMGPPALAPGPKPDSLDPGVRCIAIDPSKTVDGRSAIVYASLDAKDRPEKPDGQKPSPRLVLEEVRGIYRSCDGGNTFAQMREFSALPGHPRSVRHMYCGRDGALFVSHERGVARLDADGWKDITPASMTSPDEGGLGVNPLNAKEVVFIGKSKPKGKGKYYHQSIFRSRDGGQTWDWVSNDEDQLIVAEPLPWDRKMPAPASGSGFAFDPHHPGRGYLLDAFMAYRIDDIWAKKPVLRAMWKGVENTVALTLCSPAGSKDGLAPALLSGLSDIRGFRHADIHRPPEVYVQPTQSKEIDWTTYVTGYDYCEQNPAVIMCAKHDEAMRPGKVLISSDGGQTWTQVSDPIGKNYGGAKIAVSARWTGGTDGLKAVLAPGNGQSPRYTRDGGRTWAVCKTTAGAEMKTFSYMPHAYNFSQCVAADRVDGDAFYLYRFSGEFWVSRDGGATWAQKELKNVKAVIWDSLSPASIQAAPGRAGEVWAGFANFGIRRTRDFGQAWETMPGLVQSNKLDISRNDDGRPCLVTFGAPAPGKPSDQPTVFVFARVAGESRHSLLRSSDIAAEKMSEMKWERVQKWEFGGLMPNLMQGSRQEFGSVFMSASDHGIICGRAADRRGKKDWPPMDADKRR